MKAAIYARFSSEQQNEKSADDQLDACRKFVAGLDGIVVTAHKDEAISGADFKTRPGIQAILEEAKRGLFDTLVAESLDRISRDEEHMAYMRKRLEAAGVKFLTINDGAPSRMEIGLKSLMGGLFLEELSKKTKRGQRAALDRGRIPGGRCFGYDVDREAPSGRCINEHQAQVIREIFESYSRGTSVTRIVKRLNDRNEPSPRDSVWRVNTIVGSKKGVNGILRNTLYTGYFLFERNRFSKNPDTEKRMKSVRPEDEWLKRDFPELRIIDEELWKKVQKRIVEQSRDFRSPPRKAKRLLSGLLKCGHCGSGYIIINRAKVGCSGRKDGICSNSRLAPIAEIEERVFSGLREQLLAPEAIEQAVDHARTEMAVLRRAKTHNRNRLEKELAELQRKLNRMADAFVEGTPLKTLEEKMRLMESRKHDIEIQLANEPEDKIELHPAISQKYRQIVAYLHAALTPPIKPQQSHPRATGVMALARRGRDETEEELLAREAAYEAVRQLIDEIRVYEDGPLTDKRGGGPVRLEIHGQMAALLGSENNCRDALVAGARFELTTFRL